MNARVNNFLTLFQGKHIVAIEQKQCNRVQKKTDHEYFVFFAGRQFSCNIFPSFVY